MGRLNERSPSSDTMTAGAMQPGDVRTIFDPKSGRSWTLYRTDRPYAYDLADAYNAELADPEREWAVGDSGGIYLRIKPEVTEKRTRDTEVHQERQRRIFLACRHKYSGDAA